MYNLRIVDGLVYLSHNYLLVNGINSKTIEKWYERNISSRIYIDKHIYIQYESIPSPSRNKLPSLKELISEERALKDDTCTNEFYNRLEKAYTKDFIQYREFYKAKNISPDKINDYARHHSVWAEIIKAHGEKKRQKLRNLWEAYNRLYPGKYAYHRMNPCIKTCKTEGIERLLIKQYKGSETKFNELYDKWVLDALSSGKGYSKVSIHKKVCELTQMFGYTQPSLTWVKNKCRILEPLVSASRNGQDRDIASVLPYASIERASKSNMQWQLDGWRLPFYMESFKTLTLLWVMDACSGKIIGYEIAATENTETILKGIENAVETTGVLPLEIVSDNHSFNKTQEAGYFRESLDKFAGTEWNVSSNPRYKSLVERSFKAFGEQYCKDQQGYIGEGIRTRNENGRTTQELLDQYTKSGSWLLPEHIELIAIKCIEDYNSTVGKDGKTRNERYDANRGEKENTVDLYTRLRLFTRAIPYIVRRGQINIEREKVLYEFQLKASQYKLLNNKKVLVRYVDFDKIFLFDIETDQFIGAVPRKNKIHGAKADQTEEDELLYYKHKGRLSGIKNNRKLSQIDIAKKAYEIDPEAAYAMNQKLTPKDIVEEFKANGHLKELAEKIGYNLDFIPKMPSTPEVKTYSHESADGFVNKHRESPMLASEEEVRNFDINKYFEEE